MRFRSRRGGIIPRQSSAFRSERDRNVVNSLTRVHMFCTIVRVRSHRNSTAYEEQLGSLVYSSFR